MDSHLNEDGVPGIISFFNVMIFYDCQPVKQKKNEDEFMVKK